MKGGEHQVIEVVELAIHCCSKLLVDGGGVWLVGLFEGVEAVAESLREPMRDDTLEVLSPITRLSCGGGGLPLAELLICSISSPM